MPSGILRGLLFGALLTSTMIGLGATTKSNPFLSIVRRNAFALRPRTPQTAPPAAVATPVEVCLTGISTMCGKKQALLQITDKTPGKKTDFSPPLMEGDARGRVQVISIRPEEGAVVIRIDDKEQELTFEKNAPRPSGPGPTRPVPTSTALALQRLRIPSVPARITSGQNVMIGGGGSPGTAIPSPSGRSYVFR